MNDTLQTLRRLAAATADVLEHPFRTSAIQIAHQQLCEARAHLSQHQTYITEQDAAAAPPADDYHSQEAA